MYSPTGTCRRNLNPLRRRSRRRRHRRSSLSVGAPRIARARERWFAETPASVFIGHPSAGQPSSVAPSARHLLPREKGFRWRRLAHRFYRGKRRSAPLLPRGEGGPKGRMRARASRVRKRPALRRQLLQQRRGLEIVAELGLKFLEPGEHRLQSDRVGVEHRAAAIDRPAVAVDPDDVDVGGALGFTLFEDFRALVDHRIEAALEDFSVADLALLDSL